MVAVAADPFLFNPELLESALRANRPPVAAFKENLERGHAYLKLRFEMGAPVEDLVHQRAWLVDQILIRAWSLNGLLGKGKALVAAGGYGRGELLPCSDVDITLLVRSEKNPKINAQIEAFLTFLWDIGLEVGHSVRTIGQCRKAAAADITIATNLMEARLIAGDDRLFEHMMTATGPTRIWPDRAFFEAKLDEQQARHRKFNDTSHNLEPHVKEGPGGLRDIQMIGWVAKRHFGARTLRDLVDHNFLTEDEFQTLNAAQSLLWRIRFALHIITGRREDRLLFDHQRAVAQQFGYNDDEGPQLGVERFMRLYYRTVTEVNRLNEMLLQLFQEAILYPDENAEIRPLNRRFQLRNDFIEVRNDRVFRRYPFALLEIFLLLQQDPKIKGVRASTIRLIRDQRHLVDEKFRNDLRARSLFLEILRQPRRLGHELERMHRYGILGAYLPAFAAVEGLMQFDLFHVYTVDEHTLVVIRNMRRFASPDHPEDLPACRRIMATLPKPELLYIAGLFHDIAKGRGGDHSELGADDALAFCLHHGLGHYDARLVAWLVRHHLKMSITAQRQDISDPEVINAFAGLVGDRMHLDYLYLHTVADIRGTNPVLWNSWKDALLAELYNSTLRALRRGLENPIDKSERIEETQQQALELLDDIKAGRPAIRRLWDSLAEDYFLRHLADEIAWHTRAIVHCRGEDLPLVLLREQTRRGGTEIFVYSSDQNHIFAVTTRVLDQMGLTILDARIITSADGYTLDTYIVLDADTHEVIGDPDRADQIVAALRQALKAPQLRMPRSSRRPGRRLKHFRIPTEVSFRADETNARTIMEVIATDRPGILARIAVALQFCGARLQNAKVATFGERVEDIFYITDQENRPIEDPVRFECLRNTITEALAGA